MTAASSNTSGERKRRYTRQKEAGKMTLTPAKVALLRYIALYSVVSLPQLARLAEISPKSARRHLRELFDSGLTDVIAVARIALAAPSDTTDPSLLYGSAPNLYRTTKAGLRLLMQHDFLETEVKPAADYGPTNSYFLAHTLAIRDVRIWLELSARRITGQELLAWREGSEAYLPLEGGAKPRCVRPDSWFVYGVGERKLVGLVEIDRGTERGMRQWGRKIEDYRTLFETNALKNGTGYANARLLVFTNTERRRNSLTHLLEENASASLTTRSWLTVQSTTERVGLSELVWRRPAITGLHPLLKMT